MEQRRVASTLHTFLADPQSNLRDLNGDETPFTAMVSVPGTHKIKILYGTSGIGQVSPIARGLPALFGASVYMYNGLFSVTFMLND